MADGEAVLLEEAAPHPKMLINFSISFVRYKS